METGFGRRSFQTCDHFSLDVIPGNCAKMTAVVTILKIVTEKKKVPAFVDPVDPLDHLAVLLDGVLCNNDVSNVNLYVPIDKYHIAVI
jgi:hypothetical protein